MKFTLITKNTSNSSTKDVECVTGFQIYIRNYSSFPANNVLDLTERRLMKMNATDLLLLYRSGQIAIAWKCSKPIYVRMSRG